MEKLGLDIPDGVCRWRMPMAYAEGVMAKKAAEAKRAEREEKIVNGGRDAYVKAAGDKAGTRFDKIETRVKARQGK